MKDNINNRIRSALTAYAMAEIRAFEALPEVPFEPSESYREGIERIHESYLRMQARISKRKLIALLVAAVIIVTSITACVYREEIKNFFVGLFDDHAHFEIGETDSKLIETYYFPTYIPEGYVADERSDTDDRMVNIFYTKGIYFIAYHQSAKSNYRGNLDTEGAEYDIITVGGQQIHRTYKNNTYSMIWETERYVFGLTCHDSIGWEEIEQIILSIEEAE
jgi:hypothetical protein